MLRSPGCPRDVSRRRDDRGTEAKDRGNAGTQARRFAIRRSGRDEFPPGAAPKVGRRAAVSASNNWACPDIADAAARRPYLVRGGGVGDGVVRRGFVVFLVGVVSAACSSCGYFLVLGQ